MQIQNMVVLSIGSNQGNRLENIIHGINEIHLEIDAVDAVSKLYETPSWGFESASFYNAAVAICTLKSPQELLKAIHVIEEKLGRIRTNATEYQARPIDIDIVTFNNEHIEIPSLQIPHPQMQNRLFVLLPMNDLKVDFVHPILGKNTSELISECPDTCDWNVISELELPKEK